MNVRRSLFFICFICMLSMLNCRVEAAGSIPTKVKYQYFESGNNIFVNCKMNEAGHDGFELEFCNNTSFSPSKVLKRTSGNKGTDVYVSLKINPKVYRYVRMRSFKYNTNRTQKIYSKWSSTVIAKKINEDIVDFWVGDSRTVALFCHLFPTYISHVQGRDYPQTLIYKKCIAKDGEGYKWLSETAYKTICQKLNRKNNATIVFNMGINDCIDVPANTYINFYKKLKNKYPKATFYCMSINPMKTNAKDYKRLTVKIDRMNLQFRKFFGNKYINTSGYLKIRGFQTVKDGVHFLPTTSEMIYNFALQYISYH